MKNVLNFYPFCLLFDYYYYCCWCYSYFIVQNTKSRLCLSQHIARNISTSNKNGEEKNSKRKNENKMLFDTNKYQLSVCVCFVLFLVYFTYKLMPKSPYQAWNFDISLVNLSIHTWKYKCRKQTIRFSMKMKNANWSNWNFIQYIQMKTFTNDLSCSKYCLRYIRFSFFVRVFVHGYTTWK